MKRILALALTGFLVSGCSTIVSSVKEEPIQENHTERTTGSYVDDELIEIQAAVNISKGSE